MQQSATKHIDTLVERHPSLLSCKSAVETAVIAIVGCHKNGGKVLLCGNGGSAADAEHIVGELVKSFVLPRPITASERAALVQTAGAEANVLADRLQRGVRAFALGGASPLATAIVNDGDPNMLYAQMTFVYGQPGDILVGISTSGNSKNVVNALTVARSLNMVTIGLTGSRPAKMDDLCDIIAKAPAEETYKIQEFHLPLFHAICLAVESELFG